MSNEVVDSSLNDLAIANFRGYLQIPSVHPDVDYSECIVYLKRIAKSIDLQTNVYQYSPNKPILVATWPGQKPNLPSILLNSHMDVVPVYAENWTHDPFGAVVDKDGNIYARGTQDTKGIGIQYLEAIRRLKKKGVTLNRTIHVSFVPDEEIGGDEGMKLFVPSQDFKKLKVGFALDEGIPNPEIPIFLYNGERSTCQMRINFPGDTTHGSVLSENTAGEKMSKFLAQLYDFRRAEVKKLKENHNLSLGDVTTVNVTMLEGGVQTNVVPPQFSIVIDSRVAVTLPMKTFVGNITKWCEDAGEGVTVEYIQKGEHQPVTPVDNSNPYWVALKKATDKLKVKLDRQIMPGATDMRYIRVVDIPAFGFTPFNHTPQLAHSNDEFVNSKIFLNGIDIYSAIINEIGNLQ